MDEGEEGGGGMDPVRRARERWKREVLDPTCETSPERCEPFLTGSFNEVPRLIDPSQLTDADYMDDLGLPGEFPYTRGVQPTMYRGRLWTMRQYAGFATAEESNRRYKYLLEQGQTGLSVAFDLPTQIGFDSDDPMSEGEVGKVGVAIDSLDDLCTLMDGIPLDRVSTSMTINSTAPILMAMYVAVGRTQGVPSTALRGTIQNDILKEYMARGTYIFPPGPSMRLITDTFAWCSEHTPRFNTISISGYHIREAGSTAGQEVGLTLADGIAYVEAAQAAGLEVDSFAPRLAFFFGAHNDLLEEVAKFRASRRLWARIMRERFGARKPKSMMLRFHTQTDGVTLTAQQPENNIIRVTMQALAAVLGGTQSLHTNSFDEALSLPTEKAVRIALRSQQIMAHEAGVANTIDPLGGSYYVEHLTDRIEAEAEDIIAEVDRMGGMVPAIERGWPQRLIHESAYRYQRSVEAGETKVVGINAFTIDEEPFKEVLRVDPEVEAAQVARLQELRAGRDGGATRRALDAIRETALSDGNMLPPILEAVEAKATLGEICGVLREEWGEYRPPSVL
jgi:methylmalonyl-CoA mutase N-terminal domain/subunit